MTNTLFRLLALPLVSFAIVLMAQVSPVAAQSTGTPTNEAEFRRLFDSIWPSGKEEKWRRTAWLPSIWTGIQRAKEQERPIFLWAMNGDPLGCV